MKFKLKKKTAIELGILLVAVVILIISNVNTGLFKGQTSVDPTKTTVTCEDQRSSYESFLPSFTNQLDEAELLNEENSDLSGYDGRSSDLDEIRAFIESNPTINCEEIDDEGLQEFADNIEEYSNLIAGIVKEIETELQAAPMCPSDNKADPEHEIYINFEAAHNLIEARINQLSQTATWEQSEIDLLEDLAVSMRYLDATDIKQDDSADESEIRLSFINSGLDIELANNVIRAYNKEVVDGIVGEKCPEIDPLPVIECQAGSTIDEDTGYCVSEDEMQTRVLASQATCQYDDLFTSFDLVYTILDEAQDDPAEFDETQEAATIASVISTIPSELLTPQLASYIDSFDYEDDAQPLVDELNDIIILLTANDLCEHDTYDDLSTLMAVLAAGNTNDENDGPGITCPAGAIYSEINDIEICTCESDMTIVDPGGTCEESSEEEENTDEENREDEEEENQTPEEFVCPDGVTIVDDLELCEIVEDEDDDGQLEIVPEEDDQDLEDLFIDFDEITNEPETPEEPSDDEFLSSAPENPSDDTGLSLTTNTDSNVVASPEVQGNTGPGFMANFLLLLSVLGANFVRVFKII